MTSAESQQSHIEVYGSVGQGNLFAVAALESTNRLAIYSLATRAKVMEISATFGCGGSRATLFDVADPVVVTADYHRGVAAYDLTNGRRLWERKDVKGAQYVDPYGWKEGTLAVVVGLESAGCQILDARTGSARGSHRGVQRVLTADDGRRLLLGESGFEWAPSSASSPCFVPAAPVLSACWSPEGFLISEMRGALRAFGRDAAPLWERREGTRQANRVAWSTNLSAWLAVTWDFETSGELRLDVLDVHGNTKLSRPTGVGLGCVPVGDGNAVVTSRREVLSVPDLRLLWSLEAVK